jgi:hypothetical protein
MESDTLDLDQMQAAYHAAVEEWIAAIKQEETLASVNHTVAEVDKWYPSGEIPVHRDVLRSSWPGFRGSRFGIL